MTQIIKTRSELRGVHVHTRFWMGEVNRTLASVGELTTDTGEAQTLLAMLLLGCRATNGRVVHVHEGYLSAEWAAREDRNAG